LHGTVVTNEMSLAIKSSTIFLDMDTAGEAPFIGTGGFNYGGSG
jgi:hypothetical protein